jgi:hypothetical protein
MQETQTMEQTDLREVKRREEQICGIKRGWGHVGGVSQIFMCCKGCVSHVGCVMVWECHCVCVMCTYVDRQMRMFLL